MNKKLGLLLGTAIVGVSSIALPAVSMAEGSSYGFGQQRGTQVSVAGKDLGGGQGNEGLLDFVQTAVNWVLGLLGLITIIILIWGGFLMVTAAGDDGKYKKGFTIVKQAVIGLILIGVSALIVNLVFSFVNTNTATAGAGGGGA